MRSLGTTGQTARASALALLAAIVLLAVAFTLGTMFAEKDTAGLPGGPGVAQAASLGRGDEGLLLGFGNDLLVEKGRTVNAVVAFGGNVHVEGRVRNGVFAIGGDLLLGPDAVVGSGPTPNDVSVAVFGGETISLPGSEVVGKSLEIQGADFNRFADETGLFSPLSAGAIRWSVGLLLGLLVAYLVSALSPRQVGAVRAALLDRPAASLGWGALVAFVVGPLGSVLLLVTVIGILALVPAVAIVLPLLLLFGYVGAAALIGERILAAAGAQNEQLSIRVLAGALALNLTGLVPVLGPLAVGVVSLAGFGATVLAISHWRRRRRTTATSSLPGEGLPMNPPTVSA